MDPNASTPPNGDLEASFRNASDLRIPPYNWAPPEWGRLETVNGKRVLPDNAAGPGPFDLKVEGVKTSAEKFRAEAPNLIADGQEVSPFADFSHVDPTQFSDQDRIFVEEATASSTDPEREHVLQRLQDLVGSTSAGMKRLDTVFKWILATFHDLCKNLNHALDNPDGEMVYTSYRKAYLNRLRDLDDHEPQTKTRDADGDLEEIGPGKRGYGRTIKWIHVAPVIVGGRIVGLRVIVHWNPHSSSSGVPILHP